MVRTVLMYAPIMTRSGYGDHSRDIAYSIIRNPKYKLEIHPLNWGNTAWDGLDLNTEKGRTIEKHIVNNHIPNPDIFIQITIPNEFTRLGKYNIGITAGIETDLCKPEWIEGCNNMDMVIGTSNHTIDVFKNSIFDKHEKDTDRLVETLKLKDSLKLEVLFEGVDTSVYKTVSVTSDKMRSMLNPIKESNCYLFVGHWLEGDLGQDRKDVGMLIKIFSETFKNKPSTTRPALILKTSGSNYSVYDLEEIKTRINSITRDIKNCPSIYLIHGNLTESEMNELYNFNKIKAMISFTKGEGFGRPLLEFTTSGKPVVASNWSGQIDFLNTEMCVLLPGDLTDVHKSVHNAWFMKESKWFTVNYIYAMKVLQSLENNYKEYKKMAENQKKYTSKHFTFDKMSEKLYSILDGIKVAEEIVLNLPKLKI